MKYRQLGRTGFTVSEISLGTVEIGMPYGIAENGTLHCPDESDAARLLHRALDLGVNLIDTARAYGESEAIIGRTLRNRRKEFILVSKALPDRVTASAHESLRLLQTDVIDLMMIHSAPADVIGRGDAFEALDGLKRKGYIRAIGASVYGEDAALTAIDAGGYDCLQIAYSVVDRRPEARLLSQADRNGVGLVARSVLLKGALSERRRHLPDTLSGLKSAVQRMQVLAIRENMSLPELAYRYVLSQRLPHTALVGTASIAELEQAVDFAARGPLSSRQADEIRSLPMPHPHDLNPGNWPQS